jgi:hypothetical protein
MKNTLQFLAATALTGFLTATPVTAQLRITEVMGQASAGTASTLNGDWWELTNFGSSPVNLLGYQWADSEDALPGTDSNFFPSFTLDPGQSLIVLEEDAYSKDAWRTMWGVSASVAILTEDDMIDDATPEGDTFSGLSTGGDVVNFYSPAGALLDSYGFGPVTRGVTFEINGGGTDLGLSVVGEYGAVLASNGDIGSPGIALVPEPTALSLAGISLATLIFRQRLVALRK